MPEAKSEIRNPQAAIPPWPARPDDGHKGTFGTVIVVGGSVGMIGAAALSAGAALRAGAGLVKIATDAALLPFTLIIEPAATGVALDGTTEQRLAALRAADAHRRAVFAVGPGWGRDDARPALLRGLLGRGVPMVIDADGLNALAASNAPARDAHTDTPLVLTPHPGEFRTLADAALLDLPPDAATDPARRPAAAAALATYHHAVVVLKGRHSVVTDGTRTSINTTGNAALATAGSGDVLTGLTAGLLAQGLDAFDAAVLAVHTHGEAADRWAATHAPLGLTATALRDALPAACAQRWRTDHGADTATRPPQR